MLITKNDLTNVLKKINTNINSKLELKVDKISGKNLSTNDYTTTEKNKLADISIGANKVLNSPANGVITIDDSDVTVYTHPTGDGNLHVPTTDIINDGKVLTAGATAGLLYWSALPTSLPANGGNADTVDGKHATDFADLLHVHEDYAPGKAGTGNSSVTFNALTNTAIGENSTANGRNTTAVGKNSCIYGNSNVKASSFVDLSSPIDTIKSKWSSNIFSSSSFSIAYGENSFACGLSNLASGSNSVAFGRLSETAGDSSMALGSINSVYGACAFAQGSYCTANGDASKAQGNSCSSPGAYSFSQGANCVSEGEGSRARGCSTRSKGKYSTAEGYGTTSETYALHSMGQYNKVNNGSSTSFYSTFNAFVIGNGSSSSSLSNAFRVTFNGQTYGLSAFNSTGADYAEYFEWEDGNPNNEDRIGLFVTLNDDKIKIAERNDYILGVVSGNASIIGNACEDQWSDMYIRDPFGRLQYEEVEVEEEFLIVGEEKISTKSAGVETHIKLNPNYDPNKEYIPRSERKEWDTIGMLGQIVIKDDGSCRVNGYCTCNNGIATNSETGYRVLSRINNNLIKILFK